MKKIISVILIILCFLFVPAQVQAASPKKQVTKQAKNVIKACKSYDQQALFKYLKKTKGFYYIKNNTWNQYIKENKRHDKIKIKSVSVEGKNAWVFIEIKTIDYYELIADCISKELKRSGPIDFDRMENDIINKMAKYNSSWKKHQKEQYMDIYFQKVKGKWKISKNNRTISFPKCPYCKYEFNPNLADYDYGKMVAMANGSGSRDVVVKCKHCGFKYRVSVTIRFNASGIKEQVNE